MYKTNVLTSTDGYRFEFNTFNEYIITRKARRGRLTQQYRSLFKVKKWRNYKSLYNPKQIGNLIPVIDENTNDGDLNYILKWKRVANHRRCKIQAKREITLKWNAN